MKPSYADRRSFVVPRTAFDRTKPKSETKPSPSRHTVRIGSSLTSSLGNSDAGSSCTCPVVSLQSNLLPRSIDICFRLLSL
jgi:hypothetical protein